MNKRTLVLAIIAAALAWPAAKLVSRQTSPARSAPAADGPPAPIPDHRQTKRASRDDSPPAKAAVELVAGGRPWKLHFEDSSLPPAIRKRIAYDLNVVFGGSPTHEIDTLPKPIDTGGRQLDRLVRFANDGPPPNPVFRTPGFGGMFGDIAESDFFIPTAVSDAYGRAIALENENQPAFRALDDFVRRLNSLKDQPDADLRDLVMVADAASASAAAPESLRGRTFREPALLDVSSTTGTPLEKYGPLAATSHAATSENPEPPPPLVFHEGRWRFLLENQP